MPLTTMVLVTAVFVSGCFGSPYHYVKNSRDNAYFRIPDDWKLYDEDALIEGLDLSARSESALRETVWRVVFDSNPKSTLKKLLSARAGRTYPHGSATVERLTEEESDVVSTLLLRNALLPIDELVEVQQAEVLDYERLALDDGFRGVHLVADVLETQTGRVITVNFVAIADQESSRLYLLEVSCEERCYEEHKRDIERIIDSWTVQD